MAEHENTAGDPLEEAFNAPAAEGHPEAEEAPAATDQAAVGETPELSEEAPSEDATVCFACRRSSRTSRTVLPARRSSFGSLWRAIL